MCEWPPFRIKVSGKMDSRSKALSTLIKEVRRQLALSQEDLARKLNVSYATVNRWENAQSRPSKLAKSQLEDFCARMMEKERLTLSDELIESAGLRQE